MENSEKLKIAKMARVYRAVKMINQAELASLCGVSQRTISFLEREDFHMSVRTIKKVGEFLKSDILVFSCIAEMAKCDTVSGFVGGLA